MGRRSKKRTCKCVRAIGSARAEKGMAIPVQNWYRAGFVDYVEHIKFSFWVGNICYTYSGIFDKKLIPDQFFHHGAQNTKKQNRKTSKHFCSLVFFKTQFFLFNLWCRTFQTVHWAPKTNTLNTTVFSKKMLFSRRIHQNTVQMWPRKCWKCQISNLSWEQSAALKNDRKTL